MCTFELRRMNAWGNLWLQLALCFALLVWMRPPGPQWLAELVKDHQRSGCGTYRFLVSVVYPVLYPSGAPERRLNPAAADSLTCLWIIWVWINTYENTIFSGLFTSILTQLFWCELQGYYWFWPIPIWVFFGFPFDAPPEQQLYWSIGAASVGVADGWSCQSLAFVKSLNAAIDPRTNEPEGACQQPAIGYKGKGERFIFHHFLPTSIPFFFIPLWFPYYYH